jgi:hypothetical protein
MEVTKSCIMNLDLPSTLAEDTFKVYNGQYSLPINVVAIEIQLNLGINYPWKNQFPLKTDI